MTDIRHSNFNIEKKLKWLKSWIMVDFEVDV